MSTSFTESVIEQAALARLESAGWRVAHGASIGVDGFAPDRRAASRDAPAEAGIPQFEEARW